MAELLYKDLSYQIRGCCFTVYNTLGFGHIDNKIIVEIKAVEFIPQKYEQQLIYYLKGTNFKLGLLVNFGSPALYIKRLIWSPNYQRKSANNP